MLDSKEGQTVPITTETFQTVGSRADFVEGIAILCMFERDPTLRGVKDLTIALVSLERFSSRESPHTRTNRISTSGNLRTK